MNPDVRPADAIAPTEHNLALAALHIGLLVHRIGADQCADYLPPQDRLFALKAGGTDCALRANGAYASETGTHEHAGAGYSAGKRLQTAAEQSFVKCAQKLLQND